MLWFPTRNMLLVVVMVGLSGLGACSSSSTTTGACRIVVEPNNNHQCRIPIKSYEKWNRMWTTNCNPALIPKTKPYNKEQNKWIRPRPYAYP